MIPEVKISRCFFLLSYALGNKICHFDEIHIIQAIELNYIIVNLEWDHFTTNLKKAIWGFGGNFFYFNTQIISER